MRHLVMIAAPITIACVTYLFIRLGIRGSIISANSGSLPCFGKWPTW